jgi:ABC-type phosphate transport system permease subunit
MTNSNKPSKLKKALDTVSDRLVSIVSIALGMFLLGFIIMLLWNFVCPDVFNLPAITYWQGCAIGLLARILFGFD